MRSAGGQRFAHRFYRGLTSTTGDASTGDGFVDRTCVDCQGPCKNYASEESPRCFPCASERNPFGNIYLSIEAGGEDSTHPERIKDGTAHLNLGLRGIDKEVGKNPDGTTKLEYRPISHNELGTNRRIREHAKRTGATPLENPKRAIGGRGL